MINKSKWKKVLLILTCLGVAVGGAYSFLMTDVKNEVVSSSTWQAYSPKDDRFDIKFPLDPKESREELTIANKRVEFNQLSIEHNSAFYAVSYLDFPGHWKLLGTQKLLTKSFDMLMENESNLEEVLYKKHSNHQGDPALEYRIKQDGKEISGKFVIAGNTLYRVTVAYPLAAQEKVELDQFIDSFEIKT